MTTPRTPLSVISAFSLDGRVFRAFNHLIAAGVGQLLLIPVALAEGDLRSVVDGCPVPWEEAWAVLDTPISKSAALDGEALEWNWPRLYQVCSSGWQLDQIGLGNSGGEQKSLDRLTHLSGIRFVQIRSAA